MCRILAQKTILLLLASRIAPLATAERTSDGVEAVTVDAKAHQKIHRHSGEAAASTVQVRAQDAAKGKDAETGKELAAVSAFANTSVALETMGGDVCCWRWKSTVTQTGNGAFFVHGDTTGRQSTELGKCGFVTEGKCSDSTKPSVKMLHNLEAITAEVTEHFRAKLNDKKLASKAVFDAAVLAAQNNQKEEQGAANAVETKAIATAAEEKRDSYASAKQSFDELKRIADAEMKERDAEDKQHIAAEEAQALDHSKTLDASENQVLIKRKDHQDRADRKSVCCGYKNPGGSEYEPMIVPLTFDLRLCKKTATHTRTWGYLLAKQADLGTCTYFSECADCLKPLCGAHSACGEALNSA